MATAQKNLYQKERDRLRLIRAANVGPVTYRQLLQRFGSASAALENLPRLSQNAGRRKISIASTGSVDRELETIAKRGASLLFLDDPQYPALLSQLANAPPVLIYKGDITLVDKPATAIVGARNASAAACQFAQKLAEKLARLGCVTVSGLARGIDTAAHKGSLAGGTIAVIAGGIDTSYPPENQALQDEIAQSGLLLSEQPPDCEPKARHFPFRNRIIAGLSLGTIVVEAAPKSGSLITARLAGEAGRQVMAVPGSPLDPRSRGCNALIREGATLIQSAEDVLELIEHFDPRMNLGEPHSNSVRSGHSDFSFDKADETCVEEDIGAQERKTINGLLGITPVAVDEIIRQSGLPIGMVQMILLELEIAGFLQRHAGSKISLIMERISEQ